MPATARVARRAPIVASMNGIHHLAGTWRKKVHVYVALTEFARDKYIAGGFPAEKIVVKPNFVYPSPQPGHGRADMRSSSGV